MKYNVVLSYLLVRLLTDV